MLWRLGMAGSAKQHKCTCQLCSDEASVTVTHAKHFDGKLDMCVECAIHEITPDSDVVIFGDQPRFCPICAAHLYIETTEEDSVLRCAENNCINWRL